MIRDRGTIKWTSMMLPEHVKLLRDWTKEDTYETKPELDEQRLEELNDLFCDAMETGREVTITYFEKRRYHLFVGAVHHLDPLNERLHVVDKFGDAGWLRVKDILDIS
ncbi:YolD-like protein [Bacillus sp. THAF10]|uniref:YolD-like family protein n=1 Tax=Bacillus sp. THAF10 TaxID=2587848 RepID=UPI0012688512|nr:YolD-like family protein [Bacillus sp. THAF10]QFT89607.1 YolD-like protein [Bacillus sp. THAF10]